MNQRYSEQRENGENRRSGQEERFDETDRERDRHGSDEYRNWGRPDYRAEWDDARHRGSDDDRWRNSGRWVPAEGQRGYSGRDFAEGGDRNHQRSSAYRDLYAGGAEPERPSYAWREGPDYGGRNYGVGWNSTRGGSGPEWERGRRDFGARWEAGRGPSGGWGLEQDPYRGGGVTQQPDWGQHYRQIEGLYGREGQVGGPNWEADRERAREVGMGRHLGRGPKGYKRSDDRIKEEICEKLWRSNSVDSSEVTVLVREGEVTLSGTVPERWMRYAVENIADESMGVRDISNNIRAQRPGQESGAEPTSTARTAATQGVTGQSTKQ